jgi:CBS domain-containing protein
MKVGDYLKLLNSQLVTCSADESVETVATRLSNYNIGALPVCEAGHKLVGIISERDLVRSFAKDGVRLEGRRVRDLMRAKVITCSLDDDMAVVQKQMNDNRIRHVPAVEGDKVVAMVSIRDALAARLLETRDEVNVLRDAVIAARHR